MDKQPHRNSNFPKETYSTDDEQDAARDAAESADETPLDENIPTPALHIPNEERDEAEGGWGFQIIDLADEEEEEDDEEEDFDDGDDDFDDELDDEEDDDEPNDEDEDEELENEEKDAELEVALAAKLDDGLSVEELDEEVEDEELDDESEDDEFEDDEFNDDKTTNSEYHAVSPVLTSGDVDADWKRAEVTGEETPGGTVETPDQDVVEEIGQASGVVYHDEEPLDFAEKIGQRDRERWELDPASTDPDTRELDEEVTKQKIDPKNRRKTKASRARS